MKLISLFSGIGGFELAGEWAGWQNVVSCEINPFGRKVLEYYWPNAYHHDDIKTLTFEKIDYELTQRFGAKWNADDIILTGGFPCQPYSAAGKRLGKEDERHLWPEMLRIIREVQPKWVVGENVLGLVNWSDGLVFEEVQADLESEGYEIQPYVLPAASVGNCPHKRDRVWFVAYRTTSHPGKLRLELSSTPRTLGEGQEEICREGHKPSLQPEANGKVKHAPDTKEQGLQGGEKHRSIGGIRQNSNEQPTRFIQPNWENFPTEPPIRSRDDGFSLELVGITIPKHRNESIKAYGNAIVPQVVLQIFKAINEYQPKTQKF
jgi:DNA (cytosine-5)-methyltransferase 1